MPVKDAQFLLTMRELETFQLIGSSLSSKKIAEKLNISVKTVSAHKENIKRKLSVKSNYELLAQAVLYVSQA